MNPYDFQKLVAGLLKAMGYHVSWVSPPGPDRGIDVIAYADAFGVSGPRIKALAREVLAEGEAHKGTGLNERAFGVNAILEKFKNQPTAVAEPDPPPYEGGGGNGDSGLTAIQQAALAIDALYASDETAPLHWQEKTQLKKDLRGRVRRLVKDLDLDGWAKQVPQAVEHYAAIHYSKP